MNAFPLTGVRRDWVPALFCAGGAGAIGLAVLAAWIAGIDSGVNFGRGDEHMLPAGASVVTSLAAVLWLRRRDGDALGWPARLLLAWATTLSAWNVFWRIVGPAESGAGEPLLWEMSLLSATSLLALSIALRGLDFQTGPGRRPTHLLAIFAALVGFLAVLGHVYAEEIFLQLDRRPHGMAPHTTVAVTLLAFGVLLSRRGPGALQVLTSDGPGGVMARRLLPLVLLLPPGVDVLRMLFERAHWPADGLGRALQTTFMVLTLGGVVWRVAARANVADDARCGLAASLAESERRAREMVEALPQLVWTCTSDGRCDYLSAQWVRYTGIPEAVQLGHRWLEQVHPDDRTPTGECWREAAGSARTFDVEVRIRRHDGVYRWFKTRAEPMRGADGRIQKWFGTHTDIDEQRRAEEALRAAHDELEARVRERTAELEVATSRMRVAIEVSALGVWDWDIESGELAWDESMLRIYGRDRTEKPDYELWKSAVLPEDLSDTEAAVKWALRDNAEYDHVFRIRRPDGSVRHVHSRATVLRDASGRPVRMLGVNRDVTDEREAELRLRTSQAMLSEFVRHVPAAIAMLDRDMRYLQASERLMTDFKRGESDLVGRSHYDVFPDQPERWLAVHRRVLAGAVERADEEPFIQADGTQEWLQWEARPWRREDGEVGGVLLFCHLITARKRMELDLQCQKQELQRSNRDLEQFAFVASHDLQEPLRAVAGCVQLLQRRYGDKLDSEAHELIEHAVDGARRMQALILDLLTFSRVGTGELSRRPVKLEAPLEEALNNLSAAIAEAGAEVTRDPELPEMEVDPRRVTMLFQNLVGNAVKYRDPARPCRIHVGAARGPQGWVISVRDNGIGIEPRFFERIFVIFQRLHTRSEYTGTGIGLALCKRIVERHGGQIWVESRPGAGSVFRFTLAGNNTP